MHYDRVSGLVVLVVVTVGARPSGTWLPAGKCYFDYYYLPHLVQEKYITPVCSRFTSSQNVVFHPTTPVGLRHPRKKGNYRHNLGDGRRQISDHKD